MSGASDGKAADGDRRWRGDGVDSRESGLVPPPVGAPGSGGAGGAGPAYMGGSSSGSVTSFQRAFASALGAAGGGAVGFRDGFGSAAAIDRPLTGDPRLVFLYASPLVERLPGGGVADLTLLDVDTELELLRETLEMASREVRLSVTQATADNLRARATLGCRALHYTGHGLETCLVFEDGRGARHSLENEPLRKLVAAGGGMEGIEFVFVSACHSQSAGQAFVAAGVPHVVACRWDSKVPDHAAAIFSRNFYLALFTGKTLKEAFDIGHAAVIAAPMPIDPSTGRPQKPASVKFMLLPPYANHDVAIFPDAPPGKYIDETPEPIINTCDSVPSSFVGRNAPVQAVVEALVGGGSHRGARVVTVRGELGLGKTSVALRAAEYVAERRIFGDGIFFVSLGRDSRSDDDDSSIGITGAGGAGVPPKPAAAKSPTPLNIALMVVRQLLQTGAFEDLQRALERIVATSRQSGGTPGPREDGVASPGGSTDGTSDWLAGIPVGSLLDLLCDHAKRKHLLLLLDGVGSDPEDRTAVASFVHRFLKRTRHPAVLLTAEHALGSHSLVGVAEKVVTLGPLDNLHAAMLFWELAPRKITLDEMRGDGDTEHPEPKHAMERFSQSRLIKELGGHPKAITMAVSHLETMSVPEVAEMAPDILEQARAAPEILRTMSVSMAAPTESAEVLPSTVSAEWENAASRRRALILPDSVGRNVWMQLLRNVAGPRGMLPDTVTWAQVAEALKQHFVERVPAPASSRNLSDHDLAFLRNRMYARAAETGVSTSGDEVSIHMFAAFWAWLRPVLNLIVRLHRLWASTDPVRLHGFMDKLRARELLLGDRSKGPGTFCLRFSERHAGCIAIAYVVETEVDDSTGASVENPEGEPIHRRRVREVCHTLLQPLAGAGYRAYFHGVGEVTVDTVAEFVMLSDHLTHLYPSYPKTDILCFGNVYEEIGGKALEGEAEKKEAAAEAAGAGHDDAHGGTQAWGASDGTRNNS